MEEKQPIEPMALAEQLVQDDLATCLLDSRTVDELVDWIHEETSIKKIYIKPALRLLTPLMVKAGKKAAAWGGGILAAKSQEYLATLPYYDKLANYLLGLKAKLDSKAEGQQILEEIRAGRRPAKAGSDLSTVSLELQFQLKALAGVEEIIGLLKKQPPLLLNLLEPSGRDRLMYTAQRVPFVGRSEELKKLDQFLDSDKLFSWWLVTGSGGQGKSRLALETCLRYGGGWRVGFLKTDAGFNSWHDWQPDSPTLMVVDYAGGKAEEVRKIVATLHGRPTKLDWPVRLLLIERQAEDQQWWKDLHAAGIDGAAVGQTCYEGPLEMGRMSDDDIWATVRHVLKDEGKDLPDRSETLEALHRIDDETRPLYAAMAAESIAAGEDIGDWGKTDLLDRALEREMVRFWEPADVTEKDKNLLALATMVQGLPREKLKSLAESGLFPVLGGKGDGAFVTKRYEAMTGQSSEETLEPLVPDIVGEYFVLEHLKPDEDSDTDIAEQLRQLAWQISPLGTVQFLHRTGRDFSTHATMVLLAKSASENHAQRAYWSTLAASLIYNHSAGARSSHAQNLLDDLLALSGAYPDVLQARKAWASGAHNLATCHILAGEFGEARSLLDALLVMLGKDSDVPGLTKAWAGLVHNLIIGYTNAGEPDAARGLLDSLVAVADKYFDDAECRRRRKEAIGVLINGYYRARRGSEAQDLLGYLFPSGEVSTTLSEVVSQIRAEGHSIGFHCNAGELGKARALLDELARLAEAYPEEPEVGLELAVIVANLITAYCKLSQMDEALTLHNRLTALAERHPDQSAVRFYRARAAVDLIICYGNLSRLAEARALFDDLVILSGAYPDDSHVGLERAKGAFNLISCHLDSDLAEDARSVAQGSRHALQSRGFREFLRGHFGQEEAGLKLSFINELLKDDE